MKRQGAIESRVKALFMPKPLDEMRDPRDKFTPVQSVYSAAGVKLVTPDLQGVIPGTTVISFKTEAEFEAIKAEAEKDLSKLVTKRDIDGVVVKAGNIGGLEALLRMLDQREIPVRMADIGDISKKEIIEAEAVAEHDPYLGAIIGFDVKVVPEAKEAAKRAQIITSDVIYDAIEGYVQWAAKQREEDDRTAMSSVTPPAKIKALPGSFFRRNDPAVFGVEVAGGQAEAEVTADGLQRRGAGHPGTDPGQRKARARGNQGDAGRNLGEGTRRWGGRSGRGIPSTPSPRPTTSGC